MPGLRHVLNARLALVADQNEGQGVLVGPAELIDPWAIARFGNRTDMAGFLNRDGIARNRIVAPDLCLWLGSRDMKCAVGIKSPDGTH